MNPLSTLIRRLLITVMGIALFIVMAAASVTAAEVTLSWDPNTPAPEGYRVFARRSGEVFDYHRPVWQGDEATCTLTDLDAQTLYYFVVRAYADDVESVDSEEVYFVPPTTDSDADGMPDAWELQYGLDPRIDDADADLDDDGISNGDEFRAGLEPDYWDEGMMPDAPLPLYPESDARVKADTMLQVDEFTDADGDAHIATQWQVYDTLSGDCLMDVVSHRSLTVLLLPSLLLNGDGSYRWRARFFDSGGRASDWASETHFTTQTATEDVDGNGIPDHQEGGLVQADLNRSLLPPTDAVEPVSVAVAGDDAAATIERIVRVDPDAFDVDETTPSPVPNAMVAYKLILDRPGEQAQVTVQLSDTAPDDAVWMGYDEASGWKTYAGQATFSEDRLSVTMKALDGGTGDADGVANGIILDVVGLQATIDETPSGAEAGQGGNDTAGGGGGGCFLDSVFLAD